VRQSLYRIIVYHPALFQPRPYAGTCDRNSSRTLPRPPIQTRRGSIFCPHMVLRGWGVMRWLAFEHVRLDYRLVFIYCTFISSSFAYPTCCPLISIFYPYSIEDEPGTRFPGSRLSTLPTGMKRWVNLIFPPPAACGPPPRVSNPQQTRSSYPQVP